MSHEDDSNKLDTLLDLWSENKNPNDGHIQSLTARIQAELHSPTLKAQSTTSELQSIGMGFLAIAAMVLLLLAWRSVNTGRDERQTSLTHNPSSQRSSSISPPNLSNPMLVKSKSALFGEMQRVFDQHLAWVAETNDDVLFEVDSQPADSQAPLMCIRLVLARKSIPSNAADTPTVWELDVIVRSEQIVHIASVGSSPDLVLWPYVTNDGKVLVETQIQFPGSPDSQLAQPSSQHVQTKLLSPDAQAEQGDFDSNLVLSQSVVLLKEPAI